MLHFWVALPLSLLKLTNANVDIPTQAIAAGVNMPVASIGVGGRESKEANSIVQNWLHLGGRGIDAAYVYRNQKDVAQAIADTGVARKSLFITSKIPSCFWVKYFVEANLRQLGTDYIDLLLLHSPRIGNCTNAWLILEDYHAKGVLKAIGVSNFKKSDLQPLLQKATVAPAVNQIELNVLEHDDDIINFSVAHNITIEAYSPLGRAGSSGDIPGNKVIQRIAAQHNVTAYQVALKWILQHGHILTFQSTSQAHQQQDADLFGFNLSYADMAALDDARALVTKFFV
mmetsp:Transcript_83106/g.164875  ORF Transcript_83106/g.164875 Transcript_83106/m.164875 type:complete len:286 (-) Transcript_83106:22-879(-)